MLYCIRNAGRMDGKSKAERVIKNSAFYEDLTVKEIMFVQIWFLFLCIWNTLDKNAEDMINITGLLH